MKKILIAPDKFKGSLSAMEVCEAIENGLVSNYPEALITKLPLADGGDGSIDVISNYLNLEEVQLEVEDPLGRSIQSAYFKEDDTAFVELAKASGIALLKDHEKNPWLTSTIGTGQLMLHAIHNGCKSVKLFLGGSCTNDAGIGIAHGLGFRFLSKDNEVLHPSGGHLLNIQKIQHPDALPSFAIEILCDVKNPMFGPNGAAHTFAKQKGADQDMILKLDNGLRHFAEVLEAQLGRSVGQLEGGGAAGAIAAGLMGLFDARIKNGFEYFKNLSQLESAIDAHDIIISGEGQFDLTSMNGKVIGGIVDVLKDKQQPLYLMVGNNAVDTSQVPSSIKEIRSIMEVAPSLEDAMGHSATYIQEQVGRFVF